MSTPNAKDYQIGWICALYIELAAAKMMLDEIHDGLEGQNPRDQNKYTLGKIGKHNIAIACLPSGQYGSTSAATVAKDMLHTFSDLRLGLMVGIGGGIPSSTHDIRLGDVVVSQPEGAFGGVVQYDMGKIGQHGKLQRTGLLNSPPRALLTAVSEMRAHEMIEEPKFPSYIQNAVNHSARRQQNFGRPKSDRLFRIGCQHPQNAPTCTNCDPEWEEQREERGDNDPRTFYGIIASSNAVMKDGPTRDQIHRETGALCFEMEAAGLMLDFPCIVIRGICDYSDSHKTKQWQGYAAIAAAAYAKEFLQHIPNTQVSQGKLATELCRE